MLVRFIQIQIENRPEKAGEKTAVRNHANAVFSVAVPGKQQIQHSQRPRDARRPFFPSTRPPALSRDRFEQGEVWIMLPQVFGG